MYITQNPARNLPTELYKADLLEDWVFKKLLLSGSLKMCDLFVFFDRSLWTMAYSLGTKLRFRTLPL